jgi:glycosyltransferase involved in cell wall biosynthesis
MPGRPTFSVVIPTLNEGSLLAMTTNSILADSARDDFEILVVDDGSTDGSTAIYSRYPNPRVRVVPGGGLGVANARNLGAAQARGDYVVFLDGHCRICPDWLDGFERALAPPDVAVAGPAFTRLETPVPRGCGMFWADYSLEPSWYEPLDNEGPYEVPLTTGACQAFRRRTFDALGRYEDGFTRWGFEDVEICLRAWLLGYRVAVNPEVTIAHYFRESRGYDVDDVEVTYNFLRMLHMHFAAPRIRRVLQALDGNPFVGPALDRIYASDIFDVRAELEAVRAHDDDWFFRHVNRALQAA